MNSPQFKSGNLQAYNKKVCLSQLREVERRSILGLYLSQFLLYTGFVLILLNNLSILAPGSYFGAFSWVTVAVFSIGLFMNYVSIPYLYFSSFRNFKKENDFWDRETFWILPIFFFGTFFLYGSRISMAFLLLIVSIVVIALVHLNFSRLSRRLMKESFAQDLSMHEQYFTTMKYLTAYYLLLLVLLIVFNPLQQMMVWIRLHV
jgi:hypothetical protein